MAGSGTSASSFSVYPNSKKPVSALNTGEVQGYFVDSEYILFGGEVQGEHSVGPIYAGEIIHVDDALMLLVEVVGEVHVDVVLNILKHVFGS